MELIKTAIKKTTGSQKKHLKIYQIVLSTGPAVQIFGDNDCKDFQNRISKYGGKGLICTKHGFVNPSFIVSIDRDFHTEQDVYESYTRYNLHYEPPLADFQLPEASNINMLEAGNKDD